MTDKPTPPADALDDGGWTLTDRRAELLVELPATSVRGVTRRYENERGAAGEDSRPVRFFAVTRLAFEPPLPPGIGPAAVVPMVRPEAAQRFARRLRERGLREVERDRTERFRLPDRTRVRLRRYTATDPDLGLPLECWVGVWSATANLLVVTGGHPTVSLDAADAPSLSPAEFREEFFQLVRETGTRN